MGLFKSRSSAAKSSQSAAGAHEQLTKYPNTSTSNLSTTSTLLESPTKKQVRRRTSYEEFLAQAQEKEERRQRQQRAWIEAEKRRMGNSNDPWRGGFGPPAPVKQRDVWDWLKDNGLSGR
jgi:uncharacterized protein YecT (DUF1311 family)